MKNISDYIQNNNKQQRQSHIDLNSECYGYYLTINSRTGRKVGDLASNNISTKKAKENLLKFLNISDFKIREIHTCHLCKNDSKSSNFVCINPLHLYFGTRSENTLDIDHEIRKETAIKAGKIGGKIAIQKMTKEDKSKGGKNAAGKGAKTQIANGTHITQTISTCPHCQKIGKGRTMYRWHFDNCKYNPQNIIKAS